MQEEYGAAQKELMFNGRRSNVELAMTYYPDINEYMGMETVQIIVTGDRRIARKAS